MQELASLYDILKVLGHGGFSAVFKARRKTDEHIVALKQLDLTIQSESQKEYQDFKDEVEILKKLDHPNIVKVFGEHILDHKPSLEMEFIDGETIETLIKKQHYFSIEETLELIEQISGSLNYCHHYFLPGTAKQTDSVLLKRNSIIHNDINPKNIVRTKNEDGSIRFVLIDFGLSFTDPDSVRHSKKEEGMAEYKAPEKWAGGVVDTPSDIYSLGTVLYEMLTGKVPFPVKDYKQTGEMIQLEEKHMSASIPDICIRRIEAIKTYEPEFANATDPVACDIPFWIEMLVKKCLEKNPENRFKTGRELSQFYYDGLEGKINIPDKDETRVIIIDPVFAKTTKTAEPYLEVIPNFLTTSQHHFINKEVTNIGRWNDMLGSTLADFSIRTADKFISKNHCQILKKQNESGQITYQLADTVPSKNGTFYNMDKNTVRLESNIKVNLTEADYFWIGNTKIVFHSGGNGN